VHRVLRLLITTGIAADGLGLVVGLTALVVTIGAQPGPGQPVTMPDAIGPFASQGGGHPPVSPSGRHKGLPLRTVRVYRGTGGGERGPFRIGPPGTWGMSWAYRCGADYDGQFIATGHSPVSGNDLAVTQSGPAGRGITWASSDPGRHRLTVTSPCTWVIRVVLAPARS